MPRRYTSYVYAILYFVTSVEILILAPDFHCCRGWLDIIPNNILLDLLIRDLF